MTFIFEQSNSEIYTPHAGLQASLRSRERFWDIRVPKIGYFHKELGAKLTPLSEGVLELPETTLPY